jgi:hypothetical protein
LLTIEDNFSLISYFLRPLKMPVLQCLRMGNAPVEYDGPDSFDQLEEVLTALWKHSVISCWAPLQVAKIHLFVDDDILSMELRPKIQEPHTDGGQQGFSLQAHIPLYAPGSFFRSVASVHQLNVVTDLEFFILTGKDSAPHETDIAVFLQRMSKLEFLRLHQDAASIAIPALSMHSYLCPVLTSIILYDTNIMEVLDDAPDDITILSLLATIAHERRHTDHSIRRIELVDCILGVDRVVETEDVEHAFIKGSVGEIVVTLLEPDEAKPYRGNIEYEWNSEDDKDDGGEWPTLMEITGDTDDEPMDEDADDAEWIPNADEMEAEDEGSQKRGVIYDGREA